MVLEFGPSLCISAEYIGPGVLAQQGVLFGVLAQVTKIKAGGSRRLGL
jgi:hypothetical protein